MNRSVFSKTSLFSVFGLAFFFLIGGVFAWPHVGVETGGQRSEKLAAFSPALDKSDRIATGAMPTARVFLDLAKTVGQGAPAKRLADFKSKTEPSSQPRYWAIVDFSQRSTNKRFYVFDTVEKSVDTYYVSHGRGSEGAKDDGIAEVFSNEDGSLSSSLGIYRALDEYMGQHGRSMRLAGLEPTNSNALSRAIVLHTADYVSEGFIRQTGRLGRSEGCFAIEKAVGDRLIDQLKNNAYIIAWKG